MYRGTTPTIRIKLKGANISMLDEIFATICQADKEVTKSSKLVKTEKNNEDEPSFRWEGGLFIDTDSQIISMPLTQEDTLLFTKGHVDIQIRAITIGGNAVASNIEMLMIDRILKEGVIG